MSRPSGEIATSPTKSFTVRLAAGTIGKERLSASVPFAYLTWTTSARDPPPTYTKSPFGENVSPSQPSSTGARPISFSAATSTMLIEGGLYPPLSASRNLPSGESAVDIGSVPTATWWPATRRSEEHTSELQSHSDLVCRLLLEKKKKKNMK